jgi:hypothetical protein
LELHWPDLPLQSEVEDEKGGTALNSHSSAPMDREHVERLKRMMAGVILPVPRDIECPVERLGTESPPD